MGKGVRQRATTILTIWVKQMWGNKFDLAEQATANASPKKPQAKPRTNDPLALAREAKRRRIEDTPVEEGVDQSRSNRQMVRRRLQLVGCSSGSEAEAIGKDVLSTLGNEEHCWLDNIEVVKIYFDLQEWWETTGKTNHPIIYEIAVRIFAMPDSNGFQERVFSSCTWFDGKLSNGQKVDMTFQMRLLCYKNSASSRTTSNASMMQERNGLRIGPRLSSS
ncbi:expressed unknown protein [Seminavis robusta]|uniref:HAT C-terminal dimerisation domain-containing protein n=1 Tax=Seminavis robusta TaxID=568900 RepID=A0A9N8EB48_9STRA|nr:expressed unknown protein [Seminavis robusta]|eukprot:Sro911_g219261.1  (220) ;mRNA; f:33338-33997